MNGATAADAEREQAAEAHERSDHRRSVSPTGTAADAERSTPPQPGTGQPPSMAAQVQRLPTELPAIGDRRPRPMRGTPPECP
jgi:hypothetical protein